MAETKETKEIRARYQAYKVADLDVKLTQHGVPRRDIEYILQGGESIRMTPYSKLQPWLAGAMDRMAERIPADEAELIRQDSACCLSGVREQLARAIYKNNPTVESRFEAFSKERRIIGGKAWKDGDDYYVSYWYARPQTGYTCGCLRHVPSEPMNKLWCSCCAGHIKHHFEVALGVKAVSTCVTSVLSTCGEEACLFRLNVVSENDPADFSDAVSKFGEPVKALFTGVCGLIRSASGGLAAEKLWAKMPTFRLGDAYVRVIPFKDHINLEAAAVSAHREELQGYKITPKGFLQIYAGQEIPVDAVTAIVRESLTSGNEE